MAINIGDNAGKASFYTIHNHFQVDQRYKYKNRKVRSVNSIDITFELHLQFLKYAY